MKHFTIFMFAVALFAQSAVVAAALDAAAGTHDE